MIAFELMALVCIGALLAIGIAPILSTNNEDERPWTM